MGTNVGLALEFDTSKQPVVEMQVGLSMEVKVDTHDQGGERLPRVAQARVADPSSVYGAIERLADDRVKSIIAMNDGRAAPAAEVSGGASATRLAAIRLR